ncbi:putative o-succinylbenzoate--CoA ligase [Bradyrhizobium oligotrophicum S58]|uniref:Putative o-succinylbenzoate--CoA ligase n=1 Tax=Bradyrhizobium oligotrophicum S58 TaxID=1245469 RepID=M4Z757_9BRAD|nr:AMP-binding protein [Bradyrhizobium oligotrophicum]BAM88921.1 putative o-succinylbenzoate--CoA ligase [Bradyrhizobium oligotrophicum S58]
MVEALRSNARAMPERPAFRFLPAASVTVDISYAELDRAAVRLSAWLRKQGVGRGDRVLMFYPPGLDFVSAFFGVLYAGAVAVPLSLPRRAGGGGAIEALIENAEPALVLTSSSLLSRIDGLVSAPGRALRALATDALVIDGADDNDWIEPAPDEPCVLQYTSGSTGIPRGVAVTHGNAARNALLLGNLLELDTRSVWVSWVPHFHDLGLFGSLCTSLYHGATAVLMPPAAFVSRPVRWLEAISRFGGTVTIAPNFAYDLCLRQISEEDCVGLDLRHWRVAGSGAEPINQQTADRFADRFAQYGLARETMCPFYGLAEATLLVSGGPVGRGQSALTVSKTEMRRHRIRQPENVDDAYSIPSCGRPSPEHRILIVDPETKRPCAPDDIGEIWIDGSTTGPGYWRKPEETERVFGAYLASGEGPYLRTGDLGFMRDGDLHVSGRIKDVMVVHGQNVYPQDIELTAREAVPEITEAAAFTTIDRTDERPILVIEQPRRGWRDSASVIEMVRSAVSAHQAIELTRIVVTQHRCLPKTSSGKIQRSRARAMLAEGALPIQAEWNSELDEEAADEHRLDAIELVIALKQRTNRQQAQSIEGYLRRILDDLAGLDTGNLGADDPLMASGVTSLGLMRIKSRIESDFMIRIDPRTLWRDCSLADLAEELHACLLVSPLWANADELQSLAIEIAGMDDNEIARALSSQRA